MCTLQNLHTNSCSPSLAVSIRGVSDAHVSVRWERTNVIAAGIGLAWCIFLCEELDLLDSGTLQRRACCMVQSHSSCHMFWHIPDHRYHKLHRVYTGLLHSAAQVPTGLSTLLADRLEHRPGMIRNSSFYELDTRTCLSHRTCKKLYNPPLNDSPETPRLWASGIPGEPGVSLWLSHGRAQAQVSSADDCRTRWTPHARIQQSHPHQTWNSHPLQLGHLACARCSCHTDHRVCPSDVVRPWLPQNCLHPMRFPSLLWLSLSANNHPNQFEIEVFRKVVRYGSHSTSLWGAAGGW